MAVAISDGYVQTALGASNDGDQLLSCCHVLWGHDTPITCVDINSDLDVIVSGSQDGTVCVHTIRRGEFIRSFRPSCLGDDKASVSRVALDTTGNMVVHMNDGGLYSYTVNGVELASANAGETIHDMCICSNGEFLVTGGDDCQVRIRTVCDLKVNAELDLTRHGPVRCIAMTPDDLNPASQYLFIGSDNGSITLVDRDPDLVGLTVQT
jgi:WD40 repeat protein